MMLAGPDKSYEHGNRRLDLCHDFVENRMLRCKREHAPTGALP